MAAAPLLMAGSGMVSAIGNIMAGNAEADAMKANANTARRNAEIVRKQANEDERRFRIGSAKQIGDMRANYAASGVSTADGSALDVLADSAATAELDALTIKHQGELKAMGFEEDARADDRRAAGARLRGYVGGASALLSGASGVMKYAG